MSHSRTVLKMRTLLKTIREKHLKCFRRLIETYYLQVLQFCSVSDGCVAATSVSSRTHEICFTFCKNKLFIFFFC